jgi:predicted Zn-dependent peptidase
MGHEDWPKLRLLRDVTSGLAGTFFAELRGNRSLAYTVRAGEASRRHAGLFFGYIATGAAKEREAKEALIQEFKRLADDGVNEDDVDRAKAYFAGSTRIARQTNASHVEELTQSWMFDLGLDFSDRLLEEVQTISLDDLKEVARRYLAGDDYTSAIVSGSAE